MSIVKRFVEAFDRYMVAATFAQADARDLALQILKERKSFRKQNRKPIRQRPRLYL
jgi:hypothetical protein